MLKFLNTVLFLIFLFICVGRAKASPLPFFEKRDLTPYWRASKNESPVTVPPFRLEDQQGEPLTEKDFNEKISVVNFFFAQCGTTCPLMMHSLIKFQNSMKKSEASSKIQILSFSVTPEQDSPEVLRGYAKTHSLDLSNWKLVTGSRSEVYRLGKDIFQADRSVGNQKSDSSFIHSDNVYLVDTKRRIRGIYQSTDPKQMTLLFKDISTFAQERR